MSQGWGVVVVVRGGVAFVHGRNAHKTERNSVWSDSELLYQGWRKPWQRKAEGLAGPHSADTIRLLLRGGGGLSFQSGLTQITTSWEKVAHFTRHTCTDILNWTRIYLADSDNKQNIWMFEV